MSLDPNVKDATRLQALKTLGTVTEIGAFTEQKVTRVITSSEDARARVLEQLRSIVKADATDVQAIEADAESLLAELDPHRGAGGHEASEESHEKVHTMTHEQIPSPPNPEISPAEDPTPSK